MRLGIAMMVVFATFGCQKAAPSGAADSGSASVEPTQTGPSALVAAYLKETECKSRAKYIINPQMNLPLIMKSNKDPLSCSVKYQSLKETNCAGDGAGCMLEVKNEGEDSWYYCMNKSGSDWKIDWKCSTGYSSMSLAAYKATQPTTPGNFRVLATLSDMYTGKFRDAKKTHYSIMITSYERGSLWAFIPKTHKDARALFEAVQDGKQHFLNLELKYPPEADSDETEITRLIATSWGETKGGE